MAFPTQSLDLEAGSSQYASIADASQTGLDLNSTCTFEAWVKLESAPASGSAYGIITKWDSADASNSYRFSYQNNAGTLRLQIEWNDQVEGGTSRGVFNVDLGTGAWVHVGGAITNLSTPATVFFVDGVESAGTMELSSADEGNIKQSSTGVAVGAFLTTSPSLFFDGRISLARVWSAVRTEAQIADNKCAILGSTTNLVAEWTFDNVYTDNSGNSNTLTAVNTPSFGTDVPAVCASATPTRLNRRMLLGIGT